MPFTCHTLFSLISEMTVDNRFSRLQALPTTMRMQMLLVFLGLFWTCRISGANALNIGPLNITTSSLANGCSKQCESSFCTVAPLLRYGKYCGIGYSGCSGEQPCDGLDACCKVHDGCVQAQNGDYLSQRCNKDFLNCIDRVIASGAPTFKGSSCEMREVTELIYGVIELALVAGKALHKP